MKGDLKGEAQLESYFVNVDNNNGNCMWLYNEEVIHRTSTYPVLHVHHDTTKLPYLSLENESPF